MKNYMASDAKAHCDQKYSYRRQRNKCIKEMEGKAKDLFNYCDKNKNGSLKVGEAMDCLQSAGSGGTSLGGTRYY